MPGRSRQDDRPRPGRALPSAPLQRPARHAGRWTGQRRSTRSTPCPPARRAVAENPWGNAFGTTVTLLESELAAQRDVDRVAQPVLAHCQPVPPQRRGGADRLQAAAGRHADAAGRPHLQRGAPRRLRVAQSVGDAVRPRGAASSGRLPQPAPRATPACRPGRRRIVRSSTPTSCCGTPSASPTFRGRRTGRSCRSSTPASRCCRPASSTAIPHSTCRLRAAHCHD